jgi:hypothetical protein
MDYTVRSHVDGVEIDVPDPGDQRAALIEAIEAICEGTATCPTDEVRKVSSIRVEDQPLFMAVTLTPREGEHLDLVEVERAVHYAVEHVEANGA